MADTRTAAAIHEKRDLVCIFSSSGLLPGEPTTPPEGEARPFGGPKSEPKTPRARAGEGLSLARFREACSIRSAALASTESPHGSGDPAASSRWPRPERSAP